MLMWWASCPRNGGVAGMGTTSFSTPGTRQANWAAANYIASNGVAQPARRASSSSSADTASNGAFLHSCVGPFIKNSQTRLVAITDGTSNTFAFGETLAGMMPPHPRNLKLSWMGSSSMWADWGLNPNTCTTVAPATSCTKTQWYMFSSQHTGVVQFSMCDGSVRGIPKGSTSAAAGYNAFQELSGMKDGRVIDSDAVLNGLCVGY